jgi:maleate isomerase
MRFERGRVSAFDYSLEPLPQKTLGLVVLQSDETIEQDFRHVLPRDTALHVTRVPSGLEVSPDSLQAMEHALPAAAGLLPRGLGFDVVGYGCTSGTAQIGAERIAELTRQGVETAHVTEPVSALIAACRHLGVTRLAMLSPYVAEVSARLREVLQDAGIATPVFGSFEEAEEQKVVRIDAASVQRAATQLAEQGGVDGIFLSCTNLRTFPSIAPLEAATGLPVLSSNQVLIWDMLQKAGAALDATGPGKLLQI